MTKYHIITIGCQMNKSDSERIAQYLEDLGLVYAEQRDQANLVVLTTCGVRQSAEDRIYGLIPRLKADHPGVKIILTGCLVNRADVRRRLQTEVDIWLPITELPGLAQSLGLAVPASVNTGSFSGYLSLQAKPESTYSFFVPIGNGCNNFCTYCVVPYARGRETYRPFDEVVAEAKKFVASGAKEITLIAQNVNSYNWQGHDFADLLAAVDQIPGDFWLRFATSHPKDMSDKLIETIKNGDKICHQVHLPAQCGDDDVLCAMNRHYTIKHYLGLIKKLRDSLPDVNLSTDIIVGFPGESHKQFKNTKKLFQKASYDLAYIAQYSPRFGTPAFKMVDDVVPEEKKAREKELLQVLAKTSSRNARNYVGLTVKVLVRERKASQYMGSTSTSQAVRFPLVDHNLIGQFVQVKIKDVGDSCLLGELVN